MNIEQLRYIVEVAKTQSMLVASQQLNITQSALSQSISKLEQELDIKLFNRSRAGTKPTEIGENLIKKAIETVNKFDEFKMLSRMDHEHIRGQINIGTIPGTAMFLPKALAQYKSELPKVDINIIETNSQTIMDKIKNNSLDVGLIGLTKEGKEKDDEGLSLQIVLQGKIIAAASRTSPYGSLDTLPPQTLLEAPLVLYNDDRLEAFAKDFSEKFGPLNIFFKTNNMDAVRRAVLEDLAITIGPDYTVKSDPFVQSGDIVPLTIDQFPHHYPGMALVSLKSKKRSPTIAPFIQKLTHELTFLESFL